MPKMAVYRLSMPESIAVAKVASITAVSRAIPLSDLSQQISKADRLHRMSGRRTVRRLSVVLVLTDQPDIRPA